MRQKIHYKWQGNIEGDMASCAMGDGSYMFIPASICEEVDECIRIEKKAFLKAEKNGEITYI